jgi:hypothetical protein
MYRLYLKMAPESIAKLPYPSNVLAMGFMHGATLGVFIWCSIYSYYDDSTSSYISFDSSSGICQQLNKNVTSVFLADSYGVWSSSAAFQYKLASYKLSMTAWTSDDAAFESSMRSDIYPILKAVGDGASSRNLMENALYWLSWRATYISGYMALELQMYGDVQTVFDRRYLSIALGSFKNSSYYESCSVEPTSTFDAYTSMLSSVYTTSDLHPTGVNGSWVCPESEFIPFGYKEALDAGTYSLQIDVASVVTAFAVNQQILALSMLQSLVFTDDTHLTAMQKAYPSYRYYYDARYPSMQPILCDLSGKDTCYVVMEQLFLPFLDLYGLNTSRSFQCGFREHRCTCDSPDVPSSCSLWNIMLMLGIWNSSSAAQVDLYVGE